MVVIYKTPKDHETFDRHYFDVHVPLARKLPGLRRYEVSEGPVVSPTGDDVYFVATLFFDDLGAIKKAFATEEGRACAADRKELAPNEGDATMLLFDDRDV